MVHIALYQPDIAQNVGAIMRLCACTGVTLHIIEPCGFPWDDKKIKKAGMDYIDHVEYVRHPSWEAFRQSTKHQRIILMTTKAADNYLDFEFNDDDILLAGRESAGVPENIHQDADGRILIEMNEHVRSLNIGHATAMILGEAIRQTRI